MRFPSSISSICRYRTGPTGAGIKLTAGVIARVAMGNDWNLRAGLFRSTDENYRNFNPLFLEPTA
jgi:hypothetical protein